MASDRKGNVRARLLRLERNRKARARLAAERRRAIERRRGVKKPAGPKVDPGRMRLVSGSMRGRRKEVDRYWHVQVDEEKVGRAYIDLGDIGDGMLRHTITVLINQKWRGRGIGRFAFGAACRLSGYARVYGIARKSNVASVQAMAAAEFHRVEEFEGAELLYVWERYTPFTLIDASTKAMETAATEQAPALFPDHELRIVEGHDSRKVQLGFHEQHGCRKDLAITNILGSKFHLLPEDLATYHGVEWFDRRVCVFSFVHGWSLLGPCLWSARSTRMPSVIVHVDDHTDLGPPLLSRSNSAWRESISGRAFSLVSEADVRTAIARGIVHKGTFLAAYVECAAPGRLIHLSQALEPVSGSLVPGRVRSTPLPLHYKLTPLEIAAARVADAWGYDRIRSLPTDLADGDIWLDIDLDEFCNRFNGDSDRCGLTGSAEERRTTVTRLDRFFAELRSKRWLDRVGIVTLCVSPGFFPAECWPEALIICKRGLADSFGFSGAGFP
jgi:hypothetical protein